MKTFTVAKMLLLMVALLLIFQNDTYSQTVQFGIFSSGTTLEVKIKSGTDYTSANFLTDIDFTIRWLTTYGVSLGNVTSAYAVAKGGAETVSGPYTYQKFYYSGNSSAINLPAGVELTVMSIPINQTGSGMGTFELAPVGFITEFDPHIAIDGQRVLNSTAPFYASSTDVALPIELVDFKVAMDNLGATLSWKTATEKNNAGFDVERVAIGTDLLKKEWTKVGYVAGSGTSNAPKEYFFRNKSVQTGKYSYRLKQIDRDGGFAYSKELEAEIAAPKQFTMSQNYPNPFNPSTTINFALAENSRVTVKVYDIVGREVSTLTDGEMPAGYYNLPFDARGLSSGVYLYRIVAKYGSLAFTQTKRLMLMK
jgi:hypothetical protein